MKVRKCPFCGKIPKYIEKDKMVECQSPCCAISFWSIHIDEWNDRYTDKKPKRTEYIKE